VKTSLEIGETMKKRLRKKKGRMEEGRIHIAEDADPVAPAENLAEKVQAYEDLLKRLKADFENYKKRMHRRHSEAGDAAKKELLTKLLDVYDNMELALNRSDTSSPDVAPFLKGLEMIHKRLHDILEEEGVAAIDAEGEEFDPSVHEAVMVEEAPDETQSGRVAKELNKGFKYRDSLLRPAKVVVYGKRKEPADETDVG
jgi:molecular chaperone GrpE